MNSGIKAVTTLGLALFATAAFSAASPLRESVLRQAAIDAGLRPVEEINRSYDEQKAAIGETLFGSELLSLNSNMSCRTCHLPQFSSGDGLPNAIGVGGDGEGLSRLLGGGDIVPRNTLPLWGRGAEGFDTLFWDGKIRKNESTGMVISQFGAAPPSDDPLTVAVHLPFVEFREMIDDQRPDGRDFEDEIVEAASEIFEILIKRIRQDEVLSKDLAAAYGVKSQSLSFDHIADAVAQFIRREFRLRSTKFHRFVYEEANLTEKEMRGGLLFYGKGRCAACHNGPLFTDFEFHAIPFPQSGFGKNGFGVDYGRYNVTFDPADLYQFRTPPLYNVEHTAPYSHSGSISSLEAAIWSHVDPLKNIGAIGSDHDRQEFYRRLRAWANEPTIAESLSENDVSDLATFLRTLTYCDRDKEKFCRNNR